MIARTISLCCKNFDVVPCNVITVPPNTSTTVIPDQTSQPQEVAIVTIQNTGSNNAYYAFGQTCDNVGNYHGLLQPGLQLDVPDTHAVNVFSVGGTTISTTIFLHKGAA